MADSDQTDVPLQGASSETPRGAVAWFARSPVAAYVLLALVFLGGLLASGLIPVETFPDYDPGVIRVSVPYPGATPTEVEEDIVKRIEESLVGEIGISRFISSSRHELAVVEAEIDDYARWMSSTTFAPPSSASRTSRPGTPTNPRSRG